MDKGKRKRIIAYRMREGRKKRTLKVHMHEIL
jgi:hypothetical protein